MHLDEIVSKRRVTTFKPSVVSELNQNEPSAGVSEKSMVKSINAKAKSQYYNVYGFGNNDWGHLFQARQAKVSSPSVSMPLLASNVKQLAAGWAHSVVVLGFSFFTDLFYFFAFGFLLKNEKNLLIFRQIY